MLDIPGPSNNENTPLTDTATSSPNASDLTDATRSQQLHLYQMKSHYQIMVGIAVILLLLQKPLKRI